MAAAASVSALCALLAALGCTRTRALAVEDVHWADPSTLDLLEYLIAPGHEIGVPVVLTFRSDDDDTAQKAAVWLARVRRSQALEILRLGALSRTETAEQIELLTGEAPPPSIVDAIYRRSEGKALFTEQLVGSGDPTQPPSGVLPDDLAELFDSTLRRLGPEAGMAARALAIAGRALVSQQLMDIAGVSPGDLALALGELKSLRLIRTADADDLVALRYALLGEAVVADMLPVERVDLHRRCAIALPPGIVAGVWLLRPPSIGAWLARSRRNWIGACVPLWVLISEAEQARTLRQVPLRRRRRRR